MIKDKTFYIRYYATKHKNFIYKWDDKSKVKRKWDLDQDNYRTAIGGFSIKYEN